MPDCWTSRQLQSTTAQQACQASGGPHILLYHSPTQHDCAPHTAELQKQGAHILACRTTESDSMTAPHTPQSGKLPAFVEETRAHIRPCMQNQRTRHRTPDKWLFCSRLAEPSMVRRSSIHTDTADAGPGNTLCACHHDQHPVCKHGATRLPISAIAGHRHGSTP